MNLTLGDTPGRQGMNLTDGDTPGRDASDRAVDSACGEDQRTSTMQAGPRSGVIDRDPPGASTSISWLD